MDTTTLDSAAIESVAKLQAKTHRHEIITPKAEPDDVYLISSPDGKYQRITAEPKPLKDRLATPVELASYIRDLKSRGQEPTCGIVKVQPESVFYGFKFADRRHIATVPLRESHAWKAVKQLVGDNYGGVALSQADVYRLLRVTFRGCLLAGDTLPKIIREINWSADGKVSGTIEQSRKTLGTSLVAQVGSGSGASIPESFTVTLNVYDNFVHPVDIVIDLDPLPEVAKFRLTPYPGEIERKLDQTLQMIRAVFDSSAIDEGKTPICASYIAAPSEKP